MRTVARPRKPCRRRRADPLPGRAFRALVDRLPDPRVAGHRRGTLDDGARLLILGINLVRERLRARRPRATEEEIDRRFARYLADSERRAIDGWWKGFPWPTRRTSRRRLRR